MMKNQSFMLKPSRKRINERFYQDPFNDQLTLNFVQMPSNKEVATDRIARAKESFLRRKNEYF